MEQHADERREFQRICIDPPMSATFGGTPVDFIEVGILGARLRHDGALESPSELRVPYRGREIVMRCEVVRTFDVGASKESGLRFVAAVGDSGDLLRELLYDCVTRELEEIRDITLRRLKGRSVDGDITVRGKDASFVSYRLEGSGWKKRAVFLPEQPNIGFTVSRSEDPDEMQTLCQVYLASDDEGRRLIRLFAELSISSVLNLPPDLIA
jgi:hypothetical protein